MDMLVLNCFINCLVIFIDLYIFTIKWKLNNIILKYGKLGLFLRSISIILAIICLIYNTTLLSTHTDLLSLL